MGKGCGSGFYQNPPLLSPDLNFLSMAPDPGHQRTEPMICPSYMNVNPYPCLAPVSSTLPGFSVSGSPRLGKNEFNSWYSCYSSFHPFTLNSFFEERFSGIPYSFDQNCKKPDFRTLNPASQTTQKKFLVFDQSGDQRSLVFGTIGSPPQFTKGYMEAMNDLHNQTVPNIGHCLEQNVNLENGLNETENSGGNGSEMHEDTEDLDALLSSDYEEEEEASTGHSPSNMADCGRKEVSSSLPPKRRRYEENNGAAQEEEVDTSLMDTASSVKGSNCWDNCHGAKSGCMKKNNRLASKRGTLTKKSRRKKIKKTVGILRSIIPGGKGKDAALVLDEAIQYLKSLRLKAKALGVNPRVGRAN